MRRFFCLPKILPLFTKLVSGRCPVAEMYSLRKGYNIYIASRRIVMSWSLKMRIPQNSLDTTSGAAF